jgi:hypothetical protein
MSIYHRDTRHYCVLTLVFLQISCSDARTNRPSRSNAPDTQDSFVRYSSDNGTIIIAKPLDQAQVVDPVFEDYLHIIVACSLALVLATLLGLVIRHYGLKLPQLSERPATPHTRAADTNDRSPMNRNEAGADFDFNTSEKALGRSEGSPKFGDDMVAKPAAAYLKWR